MLLLATHQKYLSHLGRKYQWSTSGKESFAVSSVGPLWNRIVQKYYENTQNHTLSLKSQRIREDSRRMGICRLPSTILRTTAQYLRFVPELGMNPLLSLSQTRDEMTYVPTAKKTNHSLPSCTRYGKYEKCPEMFYTIDLGGSTVDILQWEGEGTFSLASLNSQTTDKSDLSWFLKMHRSIQKMQRK